MAGLYRGLGKKVFCVCDAQDEETQETLNTSLDLVLMHNESGFEKMLLAETTNKAMERFIGSIQWPDALKEKFPDAKVDLYNATLAYLRKYKGEGVSADFLVQCEFDEIPEWIRNSCVAIQEYCSPNDGDEEQEDGYEDGVEELI